MEYTQPLTSPDPIWPCLERDQSYTTNDGLTNLPLMLARPGRDRSSVIRNLQLSYPPL